MLQWSTFLLLFLGAVNGTLKPGSKETTCPCGEANRGRIIGGSKAQPNEYPWVVSLALTQGYEHVCGASIINQRVAITAAHCTNGMLGTPLSVIAGTSDLQKPGQIVPVARFIQHEKYFAQLDASRTVNDISLLLLAKDLEFSPAVGPICMPTGKVNLDSKMVKIVGWGKEDELSTTSNHLMDVDIRVKPFSACQRIYPFQTPQTQFCVQTLMKGVCKGDSGGPIAFLDPETNRYTLVGLVSFGSRNCDTAVPTAATEVSAFLPWIQSKISSLGCQKI